MGYYVPFIKCRLCVVIIITVRLKEREKRTVERVARTKIMRNAWRVLVTKAESGDHLDDLGIDVKMALKWTLNQYCRKLCTAFF